MPRASEQPAGPPIVRSELGTGPPWSRTARPCTACTSPRTAPERPPAPTTCQILVRCPIVDLPPPHPPAHPPTRPPAHPPHRLSRARRPSRCGPRLAPAHRSGERIAPPTASNPSHRPPPAPPLTHCLMPRARTAHPSPQHACHVLSTTGAAHPRRMRCASTTSGLPHSPGQNSYLPTDLSIYPRSPCAQHTQARNRRSAAKRNRSVTSDACLYCPP